MKPRESNETPLQILPLICFHLFIREHLAPDTKPNISPLKANEENFCPSWHSENRFSASYHSKFVLKLPSPKSFRLNGPRSVFTHKHTPGKFNSMTPKNYQSVLMEKVDNCGAEQEFPWNTHQRCSAHSSLLHSSLLFFPSILLGWLNSLARGVYLQGCSCVCVCLGWPVSLMPSSAGRSIRSLQSLDYDAYFLLNKLL